MHVLVTGGTGFVGSYLTGMLCARDDKITIVSRRPDHVRTARAGVKAVEWLPDLSKFDAVVHLAGEPIFGKRWSTVQKRNLRSSRIASTKKIVASLVDADPKPKAFVCASAIGYYGDRPGEKLVEDSRPGADFLAQLCVDWEKEALAAEAAAGVRTVCVRTGVVLGPDGGALRKMLRPFRMFVGGPLGSGRQAFSWIHEEDLARLIEFAIDEPEVRGPLNATSPSPVTMKEFARTLGRVLHRPAFCPAPEFALRLALGEVATVLVADQRVIPTRALAAGFEFKHAELEPALTDLLQRYLLEARA